ncbi:MAG: hypothetical protein IPQ10_08120 [Saprospiraceae bacterium]|nr:hypothetical protein [Saprospiraceae bacterium]
MNKNKKELIIESFQKMDLNMLDILLDENRTYQDATKEVFLEKLNIVFSKLKNNGDTLLSTYEGFCNSDACHNKSCKGYSFVGNKSKKHIDLIFEELDNDVKDICHCNGFKTYETFVETENLIMIDVKNDEKADFKPSINFLIISQKCKLAYEELIHYQNKIIDKEVYLTWLAKHHSLYDSIIRFSSYYSEIDKFYWLYNRMEEMKEFCSQVMLQRGYRNFSND